MQEKQQTYFLKVLEAESLRSGSACQFVVRAVCMACGPWPCLHAVSSHGLSLVCVHKREVREGDALVILPFLIRILNLSDQGSP